MAGTKARFWDHCFLLSIWIINICNLSELLYTIVHFDDTSVIMSGNDLKSLIQFVNSELLLFGEVLIRDSWD